MAQPYTTYHPVRDKEPILRTVVCEIRYSDGFLYLDRCGRLLKKLTRDWPEWIVQPEPTPQGTTLVNIVAGTSIGLSPRSANITLDRSSELIDADAHAVFVQQVENVLGLVLNELEITEFTRLGYREVYNFAFDKREDSEQWIRSLGLFSVDQGLLDSFRAKEEALGIALVAKGEDCYYRIAVDGIERTAQIPIGDATISIRESRVDKHQKRALIEALKQKRHRQLAAAYGVSLDIDAYQLNPAEPDLAAYVKSHNESNMERFRAAVNKGSNKGA